ncbi:MAG TPA: hypothetical protein O0X33_03960 [Methanocorpusculum sp.]|nr:hypothetical protein [Methanocorpusculum sp.]
MPESEKPKAWIIIRDGQIVKNNGVDGLAFAQLITAYQRALDNIGLSKYGDNYNKEDCRLYFKEIHHGSAVIPVYPATYGTCLDDVVPPFQKITSTFEYLVKELTINPDRFPSILESEITDEPARIGVLKSMVTLGSSGSKVEIKTDVNRPNEGVFVPAQKIDELQELVLEYGGTGHMSVQGIIVKINGDGKYYFSIKAKNGRTISCYYNPEIENKVKSLYKCWVRVTGYMTKGQRTLKINPVDSLEKQVTEELTSLGQYTLQKPIQFQLSYDNENSLWCLENDDLALNGYGATYHRAIQCLAECLEGHVIFFTEYPDSEQTDEGLLIKNKLQEYIDFDQVLAHIREEGDGN